MRQLSGVLKSVDADIAHCFDTKLSLMVAFAAGGDLRTQIVRTINGRGWIYSSRSPAAMGLRCLYHPLQRQAARSTAATVFEHDGDYAFFAEHGLLGDTEAVIIPAPASMSKASSAPAPAAPRAKLCGRSWAWAMRPWLSPRRA